MVKDTSLEGAGPKKENEFAVDPHIELEIVLKIPKQTQDGLFVAEGYKALPPGARQ